MGTAEQIRLCLDTITDWTHEYTATFGIVFNKVGPSALDNAAIRYANASEWWNLRHVKRMAEIIGYNSTTLEEKTKQMLDNQRIGTADGLPRTWNTGYWWNWDYCVLDCFRWAKQLGYRTDKFADVNKAFSTLKNKRYPLPTSKPYVFYAWDPDTGETLSMLGGRWHQIGALCGVWLKFYELGVKDALNMAFEEWKLLNDVYWKDNHYIYAPDLPDYEVRNPDVFQTFTKAFTINPFLFATQFYRIVIDLQSRYLSKGWDSQQWCGKYVTVHHCPSNLELRLDGMHGWAVLHMFYDYLSDGSKENMRKMLLGDGMVSASEALLNSALFSGNRFRQTDKASYDDAWTIWGCMVLFLTSIIPNTGHLAVPVQVEGFGPIEWAFFDPNNFGFNYATRQIKIPVYHGKLQFKFGDKVAEATFPSDGIYTVTFSSDWNSVTGISYVGPFTSRTLGKFYTPTPIEYETALLATILASYPIYQLSRYLIRHIKERIGGG
jgi:hypothetical protein